MANRADELIGEVLRRIHDVIHEHDVTYEEYGVMKQWLIDVGEAGEWPLFLDVFVESAVEEQVFRDRDGSQGTILGPYHLPDAPVLDAPYELPRREDEKGDRVVFSGRVTDDAGRPGGRRRARHLARRRRRLLLGLRAPAAGGHPPRQGPHERGRPLRGPHRAPGALHDPARRPHRRPVRGGGLEPVAPGPHPPDRQRRGHEPLVTQLFIDSSEHLDNDIASATKQELIVHPEPAAGEDGLAFSYDFALTRVRTASPVG